MNWSTPLEAGASPGRRARVFAAPDSNLTKKLSATALILATAAALVGAGTWAAFSATTSNSGNTFSTGDVRLTDNDNGTAMFDLTNAGPGDNAEGCIEVTYEGSLNANVHLYGTTGGSGLDQYINLTVEKGASCTGFTADATVYTGTLQGYPDDYATGVDEGNWANTDMVAYRFYVELQNDQAAEGLDATQIFTWEARTP